MKLALHFSVHYYSNVVLIARLPVGGTWERERSISLYLSPTTITNWAMSLGLFCPLAFSFLSLAVNCSSTKLAETTFVCHSRHGIFLSGALIAIQRSLPYPTRVVFSVRIVVYSDKCYSRFHRMSPIIIAFRWHCLQYKCEDCYGKYPLDFVYLNIPRYRYLKIDLF